MNARDDSARRPTRRQEIVAAAREIAAEEGWPAVSVRRIGARVGCSAAAIYQYFADKDAILAALAEDGDRRLAEAMEAAIEGIKGPGKRLRAAARSYLEFALGEPELYRVMHGLGGGAGGGAAAGQSTSVLRRLAEGVADKHGVAQPAGELADCLLTVLHGNAALALEGRIGDRQRAHDLLMTVVEDVLRGLARR